MTGEILPPLDRIDAWPALPLNAWRDTCETLHLWTQVVGKIRLAQMPLINHWWGVALYVTARGLTTSPMPNGNQQFQIDFDFLRHELQFEVSDGNRRVLPLRPQSVASFYGEVMAALQSLNVNVNIWPVPAEMANPIPFKKDETHRAYDPDAAQRFWLILLQTERVFSEFRARFLGKVSPVHFFWGSFDLAVSRFSGRSAPVHQSSPGVPDYITLEAYSHEVSSAGFWPGGGGLEYPAFYSYAYPESQGYGEFPILPPEASYNTDLHEFILPYDAVRLADSPDEMLLAFLQSTYDAAANLGRWDRRALERTP